MQGRKCGGVPGQIVGEELVEVIWDLREVNIKLLGHAHCIHFKNSVLIKNRTIDSRGSRGKGDWKQHCYTRPMLVAPEMGQQEVVLMGGDWEQEE